MGSVTDAWHRMSKAALLDGLYDKIDKVIGLLLVDMVFGAANYFKGRTDFIKTTEMSRFLER